MGTLNSAEVALGFKFNYSGASPAAIGPANLNGKIEKILQFSNGTGVGQADILYVAQRAFSASTADVIDLAGVLQDAFGAVIGAAEIVTLVVLAQDANGLATTVNLTVGGGSNPWFGWVGATGYSVKVPPGGMFMISGTDAVGLGAVTAATADLLTVTPGAAAGNYLIGILARSA